MQYRTQLSCPHTSTDTDLFWFGSRDSQHLRNSSHVCGNTYIQKDQHRDKCFILKAEPQTRQDRVKKAVGWESQRGGLNHTTAILKAGQDHHMSFHNR